MNQNVGRVRVRIPATSANLGPGFDVLGLALDFYNEVDLVVWKSGPRHLSIESEGEGADQLPRNEKNLVCRMVRRVFQKRGFKPAGLRLSLRNRIPLARGLGSSSAAIVGGLVAANAATGGKISREALVQLAVDEEGHPDNVVPALMGGLCASMASGGRTDFVVWRERRLFQGLRFAVAVPSFELSTAKARAVLPRSVPRADAVFNASRVALFLSALQARRFDLLSAAMEDKLHQPYRKKLVPGWDAVVKAARRAGAYGVALSGAGPSMLAMAPSQKAPQVARAMARAFSRGAQGLVLNVDFKGARVL